MDKLGKKKGPNQETPNKGFFQMQKEINGWRP